MKKVTILALHLGYGGIEKTLISLANMLVPFYEVEIISTYQVLETPAFSLDSKVSITYLLPHEKPNKEEFREAFHKRQIFQIAKEGMKSIRYLALRKKRMISAIKHCKSDIIISTRYLHNAWLSKYGRKDSLKIGWEHNYHDNNPKYIKHVINSIKGLDHFVLVSKELKEFYEGKTSVNCVYIPNTLGYYPKEASTLKMPRLIAIGRLAPEKGFLDLIDIFSAFHKERPTWTLDIIGDGEERKALEEKIRLYHLQNMVTLHGMRDAEYIGRYLKESSIYVLPSISESFGIVILEANSYGLPVVAFSSAGRALVEDGKNGYLIPDRDQEKMKETLVLLADDDQRRKKLGSYGRKITKNYLAENVVKYWIELIEEGK